MTSRSSCAPTRPCQRETRSCSTACSAEPRLRVQTIPAAGGRRARRARFLLGAAALIARRNAIVYTRDLGLAAFLLQWPHVRRPRVVYESHGIAPIVAREMPVLLGKPDLAPSPAKLARLNRREERVWRRAAAYVTITRALAQELESTYGPRDHVHVVPDGAPAVSGAMPPPPSGSEAAIVGYAGHLYPWKGADVLIEALALAPGLGGLMIGGHPGEPDLERLKRLAAARGIADRVEFTGLVAPRDVMGHLMRASVLVIPNTASTISERYTSPLKLFEYLSAGRAIVASDLPALREVLTDQHTAVLVAPGDAAALATALEQRGGRHRIRPRLGGARVRTRGPIHMGRARRTARSGARGGRARMISDRLVALGRCPDCRASLARHDGRVRCQSCGRIFDTAEGFLDLRPRASFAEQTKYLDHALHADARHESIAPPLLGSRVRQHMLRRFLAPGAGDRVVDLGCGNGRAMAWNAGSGAAIVGVDISPFFAAEAIAKFDLILGDLRRLPLADAAFNKAWSLDVFEHLSPQAFRDVLKEAQRVLEPDGVLFIYTHVRKNGWPAAGVRLMNRLAHACERLGLIDLRQERLRKSDHLNPIADHAELEAVAAECGFAIDRITYYSPVIGAFMENVLARIAERLLARRAGPRSSTGSGDAAESIRQARATAQARVRRGGLTYRLLVAVSTLMKLDLLLFGRVPSGPFFARLKKRPMAASTARAGQTPAVMRASGPS